MAAHLVIPRRALLSCALVAVVIGAGIAANIYLPRATITITPTTFAREVTQDITLSKQATEPDFVRFTLPTKTIEKTVTEEQTIRREGGTARPEFARGTVTLINEQRDEQPLLPKTHLKHETTGVFFLTDTAIRIPPEGRLDVTVTAKEQGASGNVPAGIFRIDKLPTSLQTVIFAESKTAFTGGEVVDTPLTEAELTAAKEQVRERSQARARGELTAAAGGAVLRDGLVTLQEEELLASVEPGSHATSFVVKVQTKARAFIVEDNDLVSLTLLALRQANKDNEEFVTYDPRSFRAEFLRADFNRGEARVRTTLTGNFAHKTPTTVFTANNLAGRTAPEVQEHFKQFNSVGDVQVTFSPFWVRSVPSRPEATNIVIKQTGSS